ncbi:MAG: hypothetical protein E7620_01300 [Ruminococcaceae bacterium]|nr:hypothetical protein [Oscillospiraceae bacterium]
MKMKAMLSSILTIALCLSLIAGSTFALFTSTDKVNVAVNSGKVSVDASYVDGSLTHTSTLGATLPETNVYTDGSTLTIERMVPGDVVTFKIHVENSSDVTAKYRTILECVEDTGLLQGLEITVAGADFVGFACSNWTELKGKEAIADVTVTVTLPEERGNEYQGKTAKFAYIVEAVQGNAKVADFDGANVRDINDLRLLASQVIMGNSYDGATVVLTGDMDLQGKPMLPIGSKGHEFLGDFDGQGYTVKNFTIAKADGAGLFGYAGKASNYTTIANVKVENFTITSNHYAGGIVGKMRGNVNNCSATNGTIVVTPEGENGNYDNGDKAGGIVGWIENGKVEYNTAKDLTISAYRDLGGIAGCALMEGVATSVSNNTVENVTLLYDASGKMYDSDPHENAGKVVGRVVHSSVVVENNTVSNCTLPVVATVTSVNDLNTVLQSAGKGSVITVSGITNDFTLSASVEGVTFVFTEDTTAVISVTGQLKDVTFRGYKNVGYTTAGYQGGVQFAAGSSGNVTFVDCYFAPASGKSGVGSNTSDVAIAFKNCAFVGGRYSFYKSGAPIQALTYENCTFEGISSWIAQTHGGTEPTVLSVVNCTFTNCMGGLFKCGSAYAAGSSFTFTGNTLINTVGHDGKESKFFELNLTNAAKLVENNTLNGAAWAPGAAQGLAGLQ